MSYKNVVNVWFPEESYCSVEAQTKEGNPIVIVIQDSLKKFEFKVFLVGIFLLYFT